MACYLIYDDAMAGYDLGRNHPLKPERFTLAIELMRAYGLLDEGAAVDSARGHTLVVRRPTAAASDKDLSLVHDPAYIETVKAASAEPERFVWHAKRGIGPGDTPAAPGLHDAAALIAGATTHALELVLETPQPTRSFAIAGGLHHAHRSYASGFCVYNDPAIAIAIALRDGRAKRVAYVDIDAHHGDGIQEIFYDSPDVLTISLHESGRYLFPGTGRERETGKGRGKGFAINVPFPPLADGACYQLAFKEVVTPALAAFDPDVLVAQCGADSHHSDPLTHLGLTLFDMRALYRRIIELAEEHCGGRLVCTGGGGYDSVHSVVPRAWTMLAAELAGVDLAERLPEAWRERAAVLAGTGASARGASMDAAHSVPRTLSEDTTPPGDPVPLLEATRAVVDRVRQASPLLS